MKIWLQGGQLCLSNSLATLRGQNLYTGRESPVHLSPTQARILSLVMLNEHLSVQEMISWLWPNPDREPDAAARAMDQHLCMLNKRLAGLGLTVKPWAQHGWAGRRLMAYAPCARPVATFDNQTSPP